MNGIVLGLLFVMVPCASAGEVIITMPDGKIQAALQQLCEWWHCWKDGATYPSDTALAQSVVDQLVSTVSLGHYPNLAYLHGTLEIRYDTPQALVQP